jgi:Domain of unknown function (DUF4349)
MNSPEDTMLMERDLAALDAALSAGRAEHDDPTARELQELALCLRSEAAGPDEDFERVMRVRMAAGFPPREGSPRARAAALRGRVPRRLPALREWWPAVGLGATLVLVVAVAVVALPGGSGGGNDDAGSAAGGGVNAPRPPAGTEASPRVLRNPRARPDATQSATDSAPPKVLRLEPAPGGGRFAPGRTNRRIERSASLELGAPADEMERLADDVNSVTARYGGFVLSSSVSSGDKEGSGGDFDLRIPATSLRPALRDLAALGALHSQTQSGRDVTRPYVTLAGRREAATAERAGLLRRLAAAATDQEAETIRAQLDAVDRRIARLRSQLRGLRLRTDYATVLVTLTADKGSGGGGGSFDDAVNDAGDLLVGAAGIAIRVLALGLPIGLLGLGGWLAGSAIRRRRRESALA